MFTVSFGVGLHVFLLLTYLGLIVVWSHESVHSIVFKVKKGNEATIGLSVILNIYYTVYTGILVYFIQSVSIRRNLLRRQALTVTHDITSAWQGLGAAVFSLYNQFIVNASFLGVAGVVAYLACLSILHVVTPTLFTLQLFNATSPLTIPTTLALPNGTMVDFSDTYLYVTAAVLPFLSRLQFNSPGLMGPTIFDVLEASLGVGNATVNATTFNVTCGSVPGKLVPQPEINFTAFPDDDSILLFIAEQTGLPLAAIDWQNLPPNMTNSTASIYGYPSDYNYTRQTILISTYNFSDSNGVVDSIFALPSTQEMYAVGDIIGDGHTYDYNVSAIQVLGCSLSMIEHTAIVDVASGNLVETQPVNFSSAWTPHVLANSNTFDFFDGWSSIFALSPADADGSELLSWRQNSTTSDYRNNIAIIDGMIMQSLGMPPFSEVPVGSPIPQLTLAMLEEAIANATALTFWYSARHTSYAGLVNLSSRSPTSSYLVSSKVDGIQATLMYRVNLNTLQLWVSIILASILLFLSIVLTRGSNISSPFDNVGLLQILWLSYRHSDIRKLMLMIEDPSAKELRRRGMTTEVKVSGELDDDSIDMDTREPLVSNDSSNN